MFILENVLPLGTSVDTVIEALRSYTVEYVVNELLESLKVDANENDLEDE